MTDETPTPGAVPAAIVCEREGCHVLVPDTLEDRREHRQGHTHDDKVEEAIRRALRLLRADFDKLRGSVRDDVRTIREEVSGIDRAVGQIEIPEQQPPLEIRRGGWDDDEDDASPSDVDEEDWGFASTDPEPDDADQPATQEFLDALPPQPTATEEAEDDEPVVDVPAAGVRPAWAR